jgi:heat shock protein HslJ
MNIRISIILLFAISLQCKTSETVNKKDKTTVQEHTDFKVAYKATSRHFLLDIKVDDSLVSVLNHNDSIAKISPTNKAITSTILKMLDTLDLATLPSLVAPGQKRFYDAKAAASLSVQQNDKTYTATDFDHGNPPAAIKELCDYIIDLAVAQDSSIKTLHGKYEVTMLDGFDLKQIKKARPTLNFAKGKVSGFNGCNSFSADALISNHTISVGLIMSTKRYCSEVAKLESGFMGLLRTVSTFEIKGDTLNLMKEGKVLISAQKAKK